MKTRLFPSPYKITRFAAFLCFPFFVPIKLQANNRVESKILNQKKILDLEFAQNYCILNSPELAASRLKERAARLNYLQSISAFLPSVDLTGRLVKLESLPDAHVHQITLSQALISPKQSIQKAQAHLSWCRALLEKVTLENRLLLSVRTAYFSCVLKKAIEGVQKNGLKLFQSSLDQERSRLIIGQSTELEVDQMQVALFQALTSYLKSRQATRAAEDDLFSLLGFAECNDCKFEIVDQEICPDRISFLSETLALLQENLSVLNHQNSSHRNIGSMIPKGLMLFDEKSRCQFIEDILAYQPALRMAKLELKSSQLTLREKKSCFWPCITANAVRNNIQYPNGTLIKGRQKWQAQIDVSFRLFDGFGRARGLRSSQLNVLAHQYQLGKKQVDLKRRISQTFFSIEVKLLAYCAARQGALVAKQALAQATERYRLGQIAPLDFRQCANQLLHANVVRESAGFDAIVAYYELCSDSAKEHRAELDQLARLLENV